MVCNIGGDSFKPGKGIFKRNCKTETWIEKIDTFVYVKLRTSEHTLKVKGKWTGKYMPCT